jgi:FtsH-binding integral membrane protein
MPDPEKPAYAPPAVTAAPPPSQPPPPPPPLPPRPSAAERRAAWAARRPLILRVLAVLAAQALAALTVGLAVGLSPPARAYVRAHGWPVGAAGIGTVLAWLALTLVQASNRPGAARAKGALLAAFSAALALFLGTLAARVPPAAAITAAVGVGGLVLAAIVAAAAGLDLTRAAALATAAAWGVLLTAAATAWVASRHADRWWVTLLAGIGVLIAGVYLAADVQALAGLGPLAGGGRVWGWRGSVNRPSHLAPDDWVGGASALATDLALGFVGVAALATGGRL